MPLTRKLTHDKRAMANYRPGKAGAMPKVPKTRSKKTLIDPELEEERLKLQAREGYRSGQSGTATDSEPKCPNMWHRIGPSIRQRTSCHKCPHHKGLETIDEEGAQYDTDF